MHLDLNVTRFCFLLDAQLKISFGILDFDGGVVSQFRDDVAKALAKASLDTIHLIARL